MLPRRTGIAVLAVLLFACENKASEPQAPAVSAEPTVAAKPPPDPLAGLSVDDLGLLLKNERIDMTAKDAPARLKAAVAKLPVKHNTVPITAARSAVAQSVASLVDALGEAGASRVDVKTVTRTGEKTDVLKIFPEQVRSTELPDCAVVGMIRKDNSIAIWHMRGGTALKYTKGLAGPDISAALVGLTDQTKRCQTSSWALTGESEVLWGFVFDLGDAVATAVPPLHVTDAVLLNEPPVAGRPVAVGK
jgi:biopolymer transport protein ExbD